MKFTIAAAVLLAASSARARPTRRDVTGDPQILNFALTLEFLESDFYRQTTAKFPASDYPAAGFQTWVGARFKQISAHEATHVKFLSDALAAAGAAAVEPCQYKFPITDLKSAIELAETLEAVGSTAYTGAIPSIANKDYVLAAASILGEEARHAAWINSAVLSGSPWDTAFQTALGPSQVFTLASQFITSCPEGNAAQLPPLTPFPALTLDGATPGKTVSASFAAPDAAKAPLYAAFIAGIGAPVFVPVQDGNNVAIPPDLIGFVFCVITNSSTAADDAATVAGPAVLKFDFNSNGDLID
ncbi:ferritin-like domain-containing protein [Mycena pura]|uniref:Ferritin-like domain-containing protein n=1 Tax=Mycena pura TaxID=153505 RepID=A0AAD6YFH8_9AGAR|nr:ferritin-like domain-containing protein [Mycena pura]